MINLCPPAIIYIIFSITQIIIDTYNGLYNTALMKVFVMIMITILLQLLCQGGLNIISWLIVFIPFILMTVIVSILLYVFGLNVTTGKLNYSQSINGVTTDASGNIIIYDPYYNPIQKSAYYSYPNFIVPSPSSYQEANMQTQSSSQNPPYYGNQSSSPAYQD
jgi:hypothetical protein